MLKPKIALWRIMIENENGEIAGFNFDIPDDLAKQIDKLIAEYYSVKWER